MQNAASPCAPRLYGFAEGCFNLEALSGGPGKLKAYLARSFLPSFPRSPTGAHSTPVPRHCLATELLSTPATMLLDSNCLNVDSVPIVCPSAAFFPRHYVSFLRRYTPAKPWFPRDGTVNLEIDTPQRVSARASS